MSEHAQSLERDILELENTRRALSNLLSFLKKASFIGSEAHQVAESINLVTHFIQQTEKASKAKKEERASIKKEEKENATAS